MTGGYIAQATLRLLLRTGVFSRFHRLWPRRLTVLAYHRIADQYDKNFKGLAENVSATPAGFAAQLDLLRSWFNIISLDDLMAWQAGRAELPSYPALITFDDGYRDNFEHALPALHSRGMPAVLFLATCCVGSAEPFYWDFAAYLFRHTLRTSADLPLLGHREWPDDAARRRTLAAWLAAVKNCPFDESSSLMAALREALEVIVPPGVFADQHLTWDQVRSLARYGVAIQAHTHSHVILSRVPAEKARDEVVSSRKHIEAEVKEPVRAFAYPNGHVGDYRVEDIEMLRREGFVAAFTLADGPCGYQELRRRPLEVRRIIVMAGDDLAHFAAKVTGLVRLARLRHTSIR